MRREQCYVRRPFQQHSQFSTAAPDPTRPLVVVLTLVLLLLVVPPLFFLSRQPAHHDGDRWARRFHLRLLPAAPVRPPFLRQPGKFARLQLRQHGDRALLRRAGGLAGRAHQRAIQGLRLSHRDHLARHAVRALCHRLAVPARPQWAAQRSDHFDRAAALQCLFHARHDPGRGFFVVAACLPAAVVGVRPGQCRIRGSRAHVRRRHFAHGDAHLDAARAAGFPRGRAADRGALDRGLRSAGAGRACPATSRC